MVTHRIQYNCFMEDQYFTEFRQQSYRQLHDLKPQDIIPYTAARVEQNYTILARPNEENIKNITSFTKDLQTIDSNQYYYRPDQLHITILGGLSMKLPKDEFVARTRPIITRYHIKFQLVGLGSNGNCSSALAYPDGFSLHNLREELREALHEKGTPYDIHLSRYEYMGWMNYMRYLQPPKEELLKTLRDNEERLFGPLPSPEVQLYKATSKILNYYPEDTMMYQYI